ncbi:MAG: DMT family transporter [Nitrospira sp.]|nr:DMT family transporter [Nitrospira sp.]
MAPSLLHTTILTLLALAAFAGNSVFCRLALTSTDIDPASFSSIRLVSGAVTLWLIVRCRRGRSELGGSWSSAGALFVYAAAFSFAYVTLPTGAGALLLFGAVQATMIGAGLWAGERMSTGQWGGFVLALVGLVALLLPGLSAPPLGGSVLILAAGLAWGIYSLQGRRNGGKLFTDASADGAVEPDNMVVGANGWAGHCVRDTVRRTRFRGGLCGLVRRVARVDCHPRRHSAIDRAGPCGARWRRIFGRTHYIAPGHSHRGDPRGRGTGAPTPHPLIASQPRIHPAAISLKIVRSVSWITERRKAC